MKSHSHPTDAGPGHANPRSLSDDALLERTRSLVGEERRILAALLRHLREVERRRLYALRGYSSLWEYCTRDLGYSEASAQRRISAMRLIQELPEVEQAVVSGRVSLSNVSMLQTFLKKEKSESRPIYSQAAKLELLEKVSGLSTRECERKLAEISPVVLVPKEKERAVSPTQTEIRFTADDRLMEKLERARGLLAHRSAGSSYAELFERLADLAIRTFDPAEKKGRNRESDRKNTAAPPAPEVKSAQRRQISASPLAPAPEPARLEAPSLPPGPEPARLEAPAPARERGLTEPSSPVPGPGPGEERAPAPAPSPTPGLARSRHIPARTEREVWRRDAGSCTYTDPVTNRRCSSRYALEIEHLTPFAKGGTHEVGNLTLRCRAHNQLTAIQSYGAKKMSVWIPGVR